MRYAELALVGINLAACDGSSAAKAGSGSPIDDAGPLRDSASGDVRSDRIAPYEAGVLPFEAAAPPPDGVGAPWDPDPEPITGFDGSWGAPGYRTSTQSFGAARCRHAAVDLFSVWSEPAAVYVRVSTSVNAFANESGPAGTIVVRNDGSGWTEVMHDSTDAAGWWDGRGLTGRLGAALLLYPGSASCPVAQLAGSTATCAPAPGDAGASDVGTEHVFVATTTQADVVFSDRVLSFDGKTWADLGGKLTKYGSLRAAWATNDTIVVVGDRQEISIRTPATGRFERQLGVPAGDYGTVWGFSENDVWAANNGGQLVHFDGAAWRVVPNTGVCPDVPIVQLWGAGKTLFFHDGSRLIRWDGTSFQTIASVPCGQTGIRGIWGNSETEVFVALSTPTCSLAWFDGREMHQF